MRWLALASGLSSLALCASACAPDDDRSADHVEVDGAAIARSDAGVVADGASAAVSGDASASPTGIDASSSARDAAAVETGTALDGASVRDATHEPAAADASSVTDAALDASSADATAPATATPSAGCGAAGRPAGGRVSVAGDHNYTFPAAYDGKQPFPLLLGFHAAGNPIDQIENLTKGSEFETRFVRAFPKSRGTAWDYNTDIAKIRSMYDDLMAHYCIDTSRVFATGHSSGAQLIVQVLTPAHKSDADHLKLKAVAPVAASRYGTVSRAIPVMYIQGSHDSVRNSNGSDVVGEFTAANACATSSKPITGPMCTSSGKPVNDGCKQYDGCTAPTVWCSHDDSAYSNTNHGWPCFATKAIFDFFSALR